MKVLYLLRHAKSSWDNPDLDDFDRPLNDRGERDAPIMGKRLRKFGLKPDIFYSSPASRAITTAKIIANCIRFPEGSIVQEKELYHASEKTFLKFVRNVPDSSHRIVVAGHNPGLTDFANSLISETIDNIPTTGIVAIEFKTDSWKEVSRNGKMILFDFPKR